jgi:uncharacterized protein YcbK (DUF882 family)
MSRALWRRRDLLIATGLTILLPGSLASGEAAPVALARPSFPRRLKLKNVHTGETFEGPYRDDTGPIPNAITDLAHFLRDFHVNKVGPLDVGTLDFLADVMDAIGETNATVLSAYRTPETNARLRATQFGVAEKSQHLYGRAIDVSQALSELEANAGSQFDPAVIEAFCVELQAGHLDLHRRLMHSVAQGQAV